MRLARTGEKYVVAKVIGDRVFTAASTISFEDAEARLAAGSAEDQIRDMMREAWTAPLGDRDSALGHDGVIHVVPKGRGK